MCNFYGVTMPNKKKVEVKANEVDISSNANVLKSVINGFDYSNALILIGDNDKQIKPVEAHWEFIPSWINNFQKVVEARKQGIPWLNATSEKLLESNMFAEAANKRRCLVLATHFYEWQQVNIPASKKKMSIPYAIKVAGEPYFFMAGIYNNFKDIYTGESFINFAIVTTQANELMQQIHNTKKRMPTILNQELSWQWLQGSLKENYIKAIASHQKASEEMEAYTISSNFKTAANPLMPSDYSAILKPNTLF
jgi:putative SOS response-associated peptidase YedK